MSEAITVIVPTTGRPTLQHTLQSFAPDLTTDDQVIVISDGPDPTTRSVVSIVDSNSQGSWYYLETATPQGAFGHPNRNHVLTHHLQTSHVWSIDDDDEAVPGALDLLRQHITDPWTIFKMRFGPNSRHPGLTLPYTHRVVYGNIGTPMIFAPSSQARFGHHYSGDFDYAQELMQLLGPPVWAQELIAVVQP